MKLIRFGKVGDEKSGILDEDNVRRVLSGFFTEWDRQFFNEGGLEKLKAFWRNLHSFPKVGDEERRAAPIARPGKIICIGLNYSDHAKESGMEVPLEPIVFQKGSNTMVGPHDPIIIPRNSEKTDREVELGIVIGRNARYLHGAESAEEYIAGYCIVNDVSERAFQLERGGQWTKGKSCDNFTPTGPWMLTREELSDVNNLELQLSVNGMQHGNTKNLIFDVDYIIHCLSQFKTLEAGDLILTETPAGVGLGMTPPVYLHGNDEVILSVEGVGVQWQRCINF